MSRSIVRRVVVSIGYGYWLQSSLLWYKRGMYGNRDAEVKDLAMAEKMIAMNQQEGQTQHVESVRAV